MQLDFRSETRGQGSLRLRDQRSRVHATTGYGCTIYSILCKRFHGEVAVTTCTAISSHRTRYVCDDSPPDIFNSVSLHASALHLTRAGGLSFVSDDKIALPMSRLRILFALAALSLWASDFFSSFNFLSNCYYCYYYLITFIIVVI